MRASGLFAILFALFVVAPSSASAVQVVLADNAANHTQATGAYVSLGAGAAPADFTAPDDYAQGMLHHRVIVTTAQANAATYKVCFVQGAQTACSANGIAINGAGTFEATQAITAFTNYGNMQWNMPMDDIQVVAMDTAGVAVDATETTWIGNPDYALYYPLDLTYQAVLVASGDAFEGYPGMVVGNPAEAPTMSPNGGTFEGGIDVTLTSTTMDAMIYYTTDGTDPDDTSTMYDGTPVSITTTTNLRAITYAAGFDPSPVTSADFTIVAQLSNGLRGRYYGEDDFRDLQMTRTDATIDFVYPDGSPPGPDLGGSYSILWTGQVTPLYSGTFTFKTVNDDGVRLWVNDELVIDDWNYHGPEERTGTVNLTANQPVSIWLEYFNGGGEGTIQLYWESPESPEEIIPASAMVPDLPAGTSATVSLFGGEMELPETNADPVFLSVRRRGAIDTAINVLLDVGGTATPAEDFVINGGQSITIPAGEFEGSFQLVLTNDELVEEDETIAVSIREDAAYTVGDPNAASITILDDDFEVDSISGTITYSGTESGRIVVEAFRETDPVYATRRVTLLNPGPYTIPDLEEGDYTVIAYIDADDDENLDGDEIWGVFQGADLQPALVTIPPAAMGIDINLDVAPGENPGDGDGDGCCSTVSGGHRAVPAWLALGLGAVVIGLRRRRR